MTPRLLRLIERFASQRILVLGDAMLDSYVVGASTRECQEAPAPVVAVHERRDCAGGAANTAANLAALGCRVDLLAVVGADDEGTRLRTVLRRHGVGTGLLTVSETRRTLAKQRIVSNGRLLARVDHGDTGPVAHDVEQHLLRHLDATFARADAVVVSDYGYGVVTPALLGGLRRLQARFRQLIAVDARDLTRYRTVGVTVVKPNYGEVLRLAGVAEPVGSRSRPEHAAGLGTTVLDLTGAWIAAMTLDADGAVVAERGLAPFRTRAIPADQARTSGAGDSYLAAFTLALAAGGTTSEAAEIAACAAAVVVGRDGTTACTALDVRRAVTRVGDVSHATETCQQHDRTPAPARISPVEEHDDQRDTDDLEQRPAGALRQA